MKFSGLIALASAALFGAANAQTTDIVSALVGYTKNNASIITGLAASSPLLSTIKSAKNITLFIPTNDAVAKLPASVLAQLSDQTVVDTVLSYHAVPGISFVPSADADLFVPTALADANLTVSGDGYQVVNVVVSGGKVVLNHGVANGPAKVIDSVVATNGVIHIVDTVLLPPVSVSQTATAAGLTTLVDTLVSAKLASIDSLKEVTIFAPTNAAFNTTLAALKSANVSLNLAQLQATLGIHVVPGVYHSTDLLKLAPVALSIGTYGGENITIEVDTTGVYVAGAGNSVAARVVTADVLVNSGVVHVIDTVLLPSTKLLTSLASNTDGLTVSQLNPVTPAVLGKTFTVPTPSAAAPSPSTTGSAPAPKSAAGRTVTSASLVLGFSAIAAVLFL
ncbi:FAS1 domain-containing protein [Polychytrium aggregatum]|uniref:FAS1 domain-containing protein n=1 Tax=Polychytrium aggregatum TaxID=110093 RepID=UPI0022FE2808|nr:FAS1 domain-containing protein [Polychytrium aggregatum]KAI9207926.1 FAS1 domain-containing protein [Polychytrium aggregatum]